MGKRRNLSKPVKAKCIDCIYDDLAPGSALSQIRACPVHDCPLWQVRPLAEHMGYKFQGFSHSFRKHFGISDEEEAALMREPYTPPPKT